MYEIDGICYAGTPMDVKRIVNAKPLIGGMVLLTFSSGERRLLDVTAVDGGAFEPLRNGIGHETLRVEHGFISWLDGEVDLAPEYAYEHSLPYDEEIPGLLAG